MNKMPCRMMSPRLTAAPGILGILRWVRVNVNKYLMELEVSLIELPRGHSFESASECWGSQVDGWQRMRVLKDSSSRGIMGILS